MCSAQPATSATAHSCSSPAPMHPQRALRCGTARSPRPAAAAAARQNSLILNASMLTMLATTAMPTQMNRKSVNCARGLTWLLHSSRGAYNQLRVVQSVAQTTTRQQQATQSGRAAAVSVVHLKAARAAPQQPECCTRCVCCTRLAQPQASCSHLLHTLKMAYSRMGDSSTM